MKEATGEFSMTVITILAIVLIGGLLAWLSPRIAGYVQNAWTDISAPGAGQPAGVTCNEGQYWNGTACADVVNPD